ncbi:hypothetical protein Fmac_030635 [Flemingia macrophylla]|uniref:Uncharacterized protein n=1 Tax=Flemingia macrophylla TaxID=520843 RepID=A0ABD1KZR3_9FABA
MLFWLPFFGSFWTKRRCFTSFCQGPETVVFGVEEVVGVTMAERRERASKGGRNL